MKQRSYLVALEEEVGLEEAEEQVHDGHHDTHGAETLEGHSVLKHLGDTETIMYHASCSEPCQK